MPAPRYCWDACTFIAFLTVEQRSPDDVAGLMEVVDLLDRGQAYILTSSLVRTEVLDDGASSDLGEKLEDLFRRPSCVAIDPNSAITTKAGQLRTACHSSGRSLKTADAIYLATAILHSVDAFHTFDEKLLNLSGLPEIDRLRVTKPRAAQTILGL